ncbi:hypothetical protein FGU71_10790 [Erythrobacter insulae]|uniref:Uncharacterized protein n=1 Tax=Erythrobacter insulae TaxID=2584124 RepID=A0A547PDU1_9SPHN|nr:hypothetical protein [Erythrobacter insulae]TRD12300.1 hypothetical protein FGU71_10790 [Erythrobacter insulae]
MTVIIPIPQANGLGVSAILKRVIALSALPMLVSACVGAANATIEWSRSFHSLGSGWTLGSYDSIHSSLICKRL